MNPTLDQAQVASPANACMAHIGLIECEGNLSVGGKTSLRITKPLPFAVVKTSPGGASHNRLLNDVQQVVVSLRNC